MKFICMCVAFGLFNMVVLGVTIANIFLKAAGKNEDNEFDAISYVALSFWIVAFLAYIVPVIIN